MTFNDECNLGANMNGSIEDGSSSDDDDDLDLTLEMLASKYFPK